MDSINSKANIVKGWNVRLKVSWEEEKKIKMTAIKNGMSISEYIKQSALKGFLTKEFLSKKKSE